MTDSARKRISAQEESLSPVSSKLALRNFKAEQTLQVRRASFAVHTYVIKAANFEISFFTSFEKGTFS